MNFEVEINLWVREKDTNDNYVGGKKFSYTGKTEYLPLGINEIARILSESLRDNATRWQDTTISSAYVKFD